VSNINSEYDLELWDSFRKGDESSLEKLFKSYYSLLLNYGHRFTPNMHLIEESAQELFIRLWNNKLSLGDTGNVKHYLFKAYRSIIFRKLKKQASNIMERLDDERYEFKIELAPDQIIIEHEAESDVIRKIQDCLSILTPRQREAIFLRFYEEMSYEQVSEILHMNIGGTYKLIYRALDRLREKLGSALLSIFLVVSRLNTLTIS
jgi:RNA polymerase sigma factor (sigma-70 family)